MKRLFSKLNFKREQGSLAIELIGVILILVIFSFFIAQFALIAQAKIVAEAAARDAVRVAAVDTNIVAVETAAANASAGFEKPIVTVSVEGENVRVNVVLTVPIIKTAFLKSYHITVSSSAVMRQEKPI